MRISRRTALRGLGISLALPWLETMQPASVLAANATGAPLRAAFLFVPNGVHIPDWTPKAAGHSFELPYILEPLAKVRDQLLILTGLTHDKGRPNGDGAGDHARSASVFLTGAQPRKTSGSNIRSGVSVDQVAARAIGKATRFPSLELGCEPGRSAGNCDSGYSCAYSSSISWAGEASPLAKETNPRLVFERLFSNGLTHESDESRGRRDTFRKSILDFVADDANRLRGKLAAADRRKVDEYLTGVREIERRLAATQEPGVSSSVPGAPVLPQGIPDDYREHVRLMCDMLVLAFQSDLTRIATFMLADAGSNRSYRLIDVPEGHHDLSHHGGDPKKHAKIRQINRFHVSQLAYLLERLKSIPEGNGTLLDHCMIVYGSGLSDGNAHNHDNLPVLLAGGGGGTLRSGRHIVYEPETPMNNLFLSLLDRLGAPHEQHGDSTDRLQNLDG